MLFYAIVFDIYTTILYNRIMKDQLVPTLVSKELTTYARNQDCAYHKHTNCEFVFIVQGNIENTVNNIKITAQAGSVFFVNNLVTHSLRQTENVYEHRDVYISAQRLQEICTRYFDEDFYRYLMRTDRMIQIKMAFDLFDFFEKRLRKNQTLYVLYKEKKDRIKKSNLNIMISLLGMLYEQLPEYPSSKQDWLNEFLAKIQSPEIFTMPINEIIKLSNYSVSYFSHQFSKNFDMSFKTYITNLKINYSKLLLGTPSMPIIEIALHCGFSSQSHFTQIFKAVTGITPHQYRRSHI